MSQSQYFSELLYKYVLGNRGAHKYRTLNDLEEEISSHFRGLVKSSDSKKSELAHAEQEAARVQAAEDDKCRKWMKEIDRVRDQQVVATMVYNESKISS